MTILSDFTHIVGDTNIRIGDGSHPNGFVPDDGFSTGGRIANQTAFISFMVKGMTSTDQNADVFVNDEKVGVLFNNKGGNADHWNTQTVSMSGGSLKDGHEANVLRVSAVQNNNPNNGGGSLDDYFIRNVICHFHQNG